ncbi:MAG: hypothetical protein IK077_02690 [Thermoguttaceae bacterium]|nr:hypothetical protein [Thermoguttaceae bacterium]
MAWMSCHNCGGYVNENGMPNGVLHYLLPFSTWDLYSKTTKPIILYITEGPKNFFTVWKCPDCGCFHLSKVWEPTVLRDYLPVALPSPPRISDEPKYRLFDDYNFEAISDAELDAEGLERSQYHYEFATVTDEFIHVFADKEFTQYLRSLRFFETQWSQSVAPYQNG